MEAAQDVEENTIGPSLLKSYMHRGVMYTQLHALLARLKVETVEDYLLKAVA